MLVLLGCGVIELLVSGAWRPGAHASGWLPLPAIGAASASVGGLGALAWVALKVGALSFGGGFVIIPLMQHDAVQTYHWMSSGAFLNAVALGQVTPGPVVATVAAVGYAAHGVGGGALAAAVAFAPSFLIRAARRRATSSACVRTSARSHSSMARARRRSARSSVRRSRWRARSRRPGSTYCWRRQPWRLLLLRRGVVPTLLWTGAVGAIIALAGGPLPH